mgnify:FL=1
MNFLGHIYLSGPDTELAIGNLVADQIKGNRISELPDKIKSGIVLHRLIDEFTDNHISYKKCVRELFPKYRHYSRVIIDMYFDHFLAANWDNFHKTPLKIYSNSFYEKLEKSCFYFNDQVQYFICNLINQKWLEKYSNLKDLEAILKQMEGRTKFPSKLAASTYDLIEKYTYFKSHFFHFMEDVTFFSKNKLKDL